MTDTPELFDKIDLAISDPGSLLYREDGETFAAWSARAVLAVVAPVLAESQAQTAQALRWLDQERELAKRSAESERVKLNQLIDECDAAEASRRDWAAEAESLDAAREKVVERLTEEIRWQKHAYRGEPRDGTDRAAKGRTIGMVDALRTVVDTFAEAEQSRSLPQCTVHPPEVPDCEVPDWSALRDACDEYCTVYMGEDDSLLPAALDKVRRAMAGEDPYNTPDGEVSGG